MKVYINQGECFWRLSYSQWVAFCKESAKTGGYDLEGYRELNGRPKDIDYDEQEDSFYATHRDVLLVKIVDWHQEDFAHWLEEHGFFEETEEEEEDEY